MSTQSLIDLTITDENIELLNKLPETLITLRINNCSKLTDEMLTNLPNTLKILTIFNCHSLENAFNNLPELLMMLIVRNCTNLIDSAFDNLPKSLESLTITECPKITDKMFEYLSSNLLSVTFGKRVRHNFYQYNRRLNVGG